MDELSRRHAMWIARAMARTNSSPLTAGDIVALEEVCVPRRVDAGTNLLSAGVQPDEVIIVREGMVHLAVRNRSLGRQTIGLVPAGGVVGDISLLLDQPMPYDAIADTDATVLAISRDKFMQLITSSPSLAVRWATATAKRVDEYQRRLITLLTKDLSAQIAVLLLDQRALEDGAWVVRMPHQTIANLLGARRQSVSRVLGSMRRDGLVRSRYGAVELLDLEGIAAVADTDLIDLDDLAATA